MKEKGILSHFFLDKKVCKKSSPVQKIAESPSLQMEKQKSPASWASKEAVFLNHL
ncbi:hypothetical protein [Cardinium endosymbiont of Sogatella furcifera]|uniref:hypothetical protein n=1 Tax=Cardinium endosymbiont of Sogatella furcifera TaxID=650378 RepID=UPI0013B396EC|nr:hypothetical protein [Cardinium endosymbiont of Sogatella furcifera]